MSVTHKFDERIKHFFKHADIIVTALLYTTWNEVFSKMHLRPPRAFELTNVKSMRDAIRFGMAFKCGHSNYSRALLVSIGVTTRRRFDDATTNLLELADLPLQPRPIAPVTSTGNHSLLAINRISSYAYRQ